MQQLSQTKINYNALQELFILADEVEKTYFNGSVDNYLTQLNLQEGNI